MALDKDIPHWSTNPKLGTRCFVQIGFSGTVTDPSGGELGTVNVEGQVRFGRDYGAAGVTTKRTAMNSLARKAIGQGYNALNAASTNTAPCIQLTRIDDDYVQVQSYQRGPTAVLDTFYGEDDYVDVEISFSCRQIYSDGSLNSQINAARELCIYVLDKLYDLF